MLILILMFMFMLILLLLFMFAAHVCLIRTRLQKRKQALPFLGNRNGECDCLTCNGNRSDLFDRHNATLTANCTRGTGCTTRSHATVVRVKRMSQRLRSTQ